MKPFESGYLKHQTVDHPLDSPQYVEVYDDEEPGHVTLYNSDGTDRFAARTVTYEPRSHFNSVLSAWARTRPLVDRRTDQTIPLPTQEIMEAYYTIWDAELAASATR